MEIDVHVTRLHDFLEVMRGDEGLFSSTKTYQLNVCPMWSSSFRENGIIRVQISKREYEFLQRADVSKMFAAPLDTTE